MFWSTGDRPALIKPLWTRWFGDEGERTAARCLRRRGMKVLARGYRTALGEVDLICRDGDCVVFVEVKTRRHGNPAEAVDLAKQRRLTLAALHFLKRHQLLETAARFDVVAITWPDAGAPIRVDHFPNAFDPPGRWQMYR